MVLLNFGHPLRLLPLARHGVSEKPRPHRKKNKKDVKTPSEEETVKKGAR